MKAKLGMKNDLIKQLYWRDFFYNILEYFPNIVTGRNRNFKPQYNKIKWIKLSSASAKQKKLWKAWTTGNTGFPVVDAAMHCLLCQLQLVVFLCVCLFAFVCLCVVC